MSYSYQYPQANQNMAFAANAKYAMPMNGGNQQAANQAACTPPVHNEQVAIQHHVYTHHVQPIKRTWMTREVQYRDVPVSQETRVVNHPMQEYCVGAPQAAPAPCAQAPAPCAAAPRPQAPHYNSCTRGGTSGSVRFY